MGMRNGEVKRAMAKKRLFCRQLMKHDKPNSKRALEKLSLGVLESSVYAAGFLFHRNELIAQLFRLRPDFISSLDFHG